jgi:hypothetical protein
VNDEWLTDISLHYDFVRANGTPEKPFIHPMYLEDPERHTTFYPTRVAKATVGNYMRTIYEIRSIVDPNSASCDLIQAEVKDVTLLPSPAFKGRVVSVTTAAWPHFFRDTKLYHDAIAAKAANVSIDSFSAADICPVTKQAHDGANVNIPEGRLKHWLLIFPPGVELDPSFLHFNDHVDKGNEIVPKFVGLVDSTLYGSDKPIRANILRLRAAEKHDGHQILKRRGRASDLF